MGELRILTTYAVHFLIVKNQIPFNSDVIMKTIKMRSFAFLGSDIYCEIDERPKSGSEKSIFNSVTGSYL